jgi:hypothetical protein
MALTVLVRGDHCRLSLRERTSFRRAKGDKVDASGRQRLARGIGAETAVRH